jgi:hypothetical protein
MSSQYIGGFITSNKTNPTGKYNTNKANGIWKLNEQLQYQTINLWPSTKSLPKYWFLNLSSSTQDWTNVSHGNGNFVVIDAQGNLYCLSVYGPTYGPYTSGICCNKITANGEISWNHTYSYSDGKMYDGTGYSILLDSTYVYYTGYGSTYTAIYNKLHSANGNVVFTKEITSSTATTGPITNLGADTSNNIYCTGTTSSTSGFWIKFDSSGNIAAAKSSIGLNARGYFSPSYISVDSSGNSYLGGSSIYEGAYLKLDSSGTAQISTCLGPTASGGGTCIGFAMEQNKANFIFVGYSTTSTGTFNIYKISATNGTGVIWSYTFSTLYYGTGYVTTDASNNVYLLSRDSDINILKSVLIKFNSSGTILWQLSITGGAPRSIAVDDNNSAIIVALSPCVYFRLPTDGSITGTFGNYTIATSSYTSSGSGASSFTSVASSIGTFSDTFSSGLGTTTSTYVAAGTRIDIQ